MAKNSPKVILDALIQREAFEFQGQQRQNIGRNSISIGDLKQDSFFYPFLRKPDFQRETNEWDAQTICDLIKSFLDGDLIPAVILWRTYGNYYFVIDGSHRLSALIAWINDDYGDGKISTEFFDGYITEEQKNAAQEARKLIENNIGSYKSYQSFKDIQGQADPKITERASNLGFLDIKLQWVEGDSSKAAESFFKINQKAAPISPTEMRLLKARKKPNGIATRAIMRSGNGHKYWSDFSQEHQDEIENLALEIHQLLFEPKLKNPIKTTDVPIVGNLSTPQKYELILEFVNIVNSVEVGKEIKNGVEVDKETKIDDDLTGEKTVKFLKNCRKISQIINSNHPSSLGLHPMIYFYTYDGRYRIGSFYGVVSLILHLDNTKSYSQFIKFREDFEWVIWNYNKVIPEIVSNSSTVQAREKVKVFYLKIIEKLSEGTDKKNAMKEIVKEKGFGSLKIKTKSDISETQSKIFTRETKSAAFIRDALPNVQRCKICGGYLHAHSISIDHKIRKADGGLGTLDNAQLTHPYCNSTIKH